MTPEEINSYVDEHLEKMLQGFIEKMRAEVIQLAQTIAKKENKELDKLDLQFALMTLGLCMTEELKERKDEANDIA